MKKKNQRVMTLRFVGSADFRKGDRGILEDIIAAKPSLKNLNEGDVVIVRSGKGDQVLFLHPSREVAGHRGKTNTVIASERLRLTWGTWSPTMLADYALMIGIKLRGIPTLDELHEKLLRGWARMLGVERKAL